MRIENLTIRGEEQTAAIKESISDDILELKQSFAMGTAVRGNSESHTVKIDEEDVIEVVYDNEISWICNSDTLAELFPEIEVQKRALDGSFVLPGYISGQDAQRGGIGNVFIKFFRLFKKKPIGKKVRELASDLERKNLGNAPGLYQVTKDFKLSPFSTSDSGKTYLLFLHGTNSSTEKSFGDVLGTQTWDVIQQSFGQNVLAFQHESLTKSPLENTLDLLNALPKNCELHLVSQSRGGLIGDILCRFCGDDDNKRGFNDAEIALFKKSDRKDDLQKIQALFVTIKNKKITIRKYIRVACPGGGTTLASRRLDHFFNITFNLIGIGTGLTTNIIFGSFKSLLVSVINTKNDVDVLPGVEAMSPSSPFIEILNAPGTDRIIDTPLAVIAGNCKAKVNLKGLLIIASKLFFGHKNDLIVDTKSMTLGGRRSLPIQRFFMEGVDVDHFNYFKNKPTNDALRDALKAVDFTQQINGFSFEISDRAIPAGDRNALIKFGILEGGGLSSKTATGTKPIVLLLPGIMGSNLAEKDKTIWIDYQRFLTGGLIRLADGNINATSIVKSSYQRLYEHLSKTYDVVTFPFDWRMNLRDTTILLNKKIKELLLFRQPIKIVGHSMGGVLARDFIVYHPDTWQELNQSPGFKMLFLGAPLGGSFRIPAVLFGEDSIINKLSKIDLFHSKEELLRMFSKMEGILSLLPYSTDEENDFSNVATWRKMAKTKGKNWPIPDNIGNLIRYKSYRDEIIKKARDIDYTNISYIAGRDKATPCGYRIEERANNESEIVFLSTAEGDQSVTWETGIPSELIKRDAVYYVNVSHGALANEPSIFKGISDILERGTTFLLSKTRPVVRGEERLFRSPVSDDFDISPEGLERTILGLSDVTSITPMEAPLQVSIRQGDLRYASYPLIVGHFKGDGVVSAEKVVDGYLGGALLQRHRLGLYPGDVGTNEISIPQYDGYKGAIVVGLGEFGNLTGYQLAQTVEQGVTNLLLMLNNKQIKVPVAGVSALLIGSAYGGLNIESSIRSVIEGTMNANRKVKENFAPKDVQLIEHIEFIELYEDVAATCLYAATKLERSKDSMMDMVVEPKKVVANLGSRRRMPFAVSEEWWTRITVKMKKEEKDLKYQGIQFNISTAGAREEERTLSTTRQIIDQLVREMSKDNLWTSARAKTLFELLIPVDFKEQLKRQNNINWVVDDDTASFPWELLQDGTVGTSKPLCVNAGMIRKLTTENFRINIKAVNNQNALVIADPNLKGFNTQLSGAKDEGKLVTSILESRGFHAKPLINETAIQIIEALFSEDYKIIHLAGHGVFNDSRFDGSGMLIGDNVFLSTREISQMSTTPEFVFINCCFLGESDANAEKYYQDRYRLAANMGTQLINNGVKAVVAAGWAVDDAAALEFTDVFYKSMFDGYDFGASVKKARVHVFDKFKHTNTWGAYQCYGDQFYKFTDSFKGESAERDLIPERFEIDLYNLQNMVDTGQYTLEEIKGRLEKISNRVDEAGLRTALMTEREAFIYAAIYDYDTCIGKFEQLLNTDNAQFSIIALEKYFNIRAKKYALDFVKSKGSREVLLPKLNKVINDLKSLLGITPSAERRNLLGSALKRKGLLTGTKAAKKEAYIESADYYRTAFRLIGNKELVYSLTNWLSIEGLLRLTGSWPKGKKAANSQEEKRLEVEYNQGIAALRKELNDQISSEDISNYWVLTKEANAKLCLLLIDTDLPTKKTKDEIFAIYRRLWERAGSAGNKWAELEHLSVLLDILSLDKKPKVLAIKKILEELKNDLEKIVSKF